MDCQPAFFNKIVYGNHIDQPTDNQGRRTQTPHPPLATLIISTLQIGQSYL